MLQITPLSISLALSTVQCPDPGSVTVSYPNSCCLGITVYAVGVGKAIEEELQEIASEPTDKHLFYAEDFSTMGEISGKLKQGICEGTVECSSGGPRPQGAVEYS